MRALLSTFKPVINLICDKEVLMRVVKRVTSLLNTDVLPQCCRTCQLNVFAIRFSVPSIDALNPSLIRSAWVLHTLKQRLHLKITLSCKPVFNFSLAAIHSIEQVVALSIERTFGHFWALRKSGMFKQFRVSGVLVEAVDLLTSCSLSRRGLSTRTGSSGDTGF